MRRIPVWLVALSGLAWAQPLNFRAQLPQLYQRAALGAELKYVDAMLSNRSRDFKAYTADAQRIDLNNERDRFASMFANATRVRLETKIVQAQEDKAGLTCQVEQRLSMEQPDPGKGRMITVVLVSESVDRWQRVGGKPRLTRTQLISQRLIRGPQLADDPRWPVRPVSPKAGIYAARASATRGRSASKHSVTPTSSNGSPPAWAFSSGTMARTLTSSRR